jgi:hypothetical protein
MISAGDESLVKKKKETRLVEIDLAATPSNFGEILKLLITKCSSKESKTKIIIICL